MKLAFIHLSDLHYVTGKAESHGVVLNKLLTDIDTQLGLLHPVKPYLILSGDIAQAGDSSDSYAALQAEIEERLKSLGLDRTRRICVPGNHDLSVNYVEKNFVNHEGVISQQLHEEQFNDYILAQPNPLTEKFANYGAFSKSFADFGIYGATITGGGHLISPEVGVYCLNTALCSSGGMKKEGKPIDDERRLAVDTRSLHDWARKCKARYKILVMHHPLHWLCDWAQHEVTTILENYFALCLSGHTHDQAAYHRLLKGSSLVECSAPPLYTSKSEDLGYAIVTLDPAHGPEDIVYRQWTRRQSFVTGSGFSDTDDGRIPLGARSSPPAIKELGEDFVDRFLTKRLDDALASFLSQPKIWVSRILSKHAETDVDADKVEKIEPLELVRNPRSVIIKAPPQFGLTCLAHHLIREAWRSAGSPLWVYLDAETIKPNTASITESVEAELALFGCTIHDINCVVLDGCTNHQKDSFKILKRVCDMFKSQPVICMQRFDPSQFLTGTIDEKIDREFEVLYLWTMTRSDIRELVTAYNDKRHVGDENAVTQRLVSDIEVINIHRTPLNCLTLLKVSEIDFDESPVNRTEMIRRVLVLLFNIDEIPTYKARPDVKDSEYVLGYFCEALLKDGKYFFTRDHFLRLSQEYCRERLIDLEVHVVFDVLHANNIIIKRGTFFYFRFAYWIYYFAAQRMHHDAAFAAFMFENMRYVQYPEIIEFYTGLDRQREDALKVLAKDVRTTWQKVRDKIKLPDEFNIYRLAEWRASPEALEKMQTEIREGVRGSNLPEIVKDQYADRHYDVAKPYDQEIRNILTEHSFVYMLSAMKAGSRALRNSDHVNPDLKRELLSEILRCWEEASKVLLVLLPVLAEKGYAVFDGAGFMLIGHWGDSFEDKLNRILAEIPVNVVALCQDDLFSQKMGPLLLEHARKETHDLRRHELMLLLIRQRPRGWRASVQEYIATVPKNSFYLYDVYRILKVQYSYGYPSRNALADMEYLILMAAVKHATGAKDPGPKMIDKYRDKLKITNGGDGAEVVPKRDT